MIARADTPYGVALYFAAGLYGAFVLVALADAYLRARSQTRNKHAKTEPIKYRNVRIR